MVWLHFGCVAPRIGRPFAAPLRTAYHPRVIDHYENPRNVGSFGAEAEGVAGPQAEHVRGGTGIVGSPACGDVMKLQIRADVRTGRILDARFKTFGCGSAIASSSLCTEWIKHKTLEEASRIRNSDVAKHLLLPPVKLHCSMLAEDAIRASIRDVQKKTPSVSPRPVHDDDLR